MSLLRRSFVWRPLLVLTITFAIMGSLAIGLVGSRPASAGQEWFIGYAGMILIEYAGGGGEGLGGYGAVGSESIWGTP